MNPNMYTSKQFSVLSDIIKIFSEGQVYLILPQSM